MTASTTTARRVFEQQVCCQAATPADSARTLPAVDIARGSEGALPNGCVSLSFAAGV